MLELKFGKQDATHDPNDLKLAHMIEPGVVLPTHWPTPNFGGGTSFKSWGMLGNDEVGDCVIASRAHMTMLDTLFGAPLTARFTTASVISEYSAVTGYDPTQTQPDGSNTTDSGTSMRAMCGYQRSKGLMDADGRRHKIGAYLILDTGNPLQTIQTIYVLGGAAIGIQVPESALEQFHAGEIWDDVGDTNILGGHEVAGVGTMNWRAELSVITWGRRQRMTFAFLRRYGDEGWCWVAPEILTAGGTWRGLSITQLNEALALLGD